MIRLITGLPGAGKSLRTVAELVRLRDAGEPRPVFIHGLDGADPSLGQQLDDPREWEDLPDGSIVVVDEAQEVWPASRSEPHASVKAMQRHRHRGFDFLICTQKPSLLHSALVALVGEHQHIYRPKGWTSVRIFTWQEAVQDVGSRVRRREAERTRWSFPEALFPLYHSASEHTHKRKVSKAHVALFLLLVVSIGGAIFGYERLERIGDDDAVVAAQSGAVQASGLSAADHVLTTAEWLDKFRPRVEAMPWSAPAYDGMPLAGPPRIFCVITELPNGRRRCRCYSEQVTPITVRDQQCQQIAIYGVYEPYVRQQQDSGAVGVGGSQDARHSGSVAAPLSQPSGGSMAGPSIHQPYKPPPPPVG